MGDASAIATGRVKWEENGLELWLGYPLKDEFDLTLAFEYDHRDEKPLLVLSWFPEECATAARITMQGERECAVRYSALEAALEAWNTEVSEEPRGQDKPASTSAVTPFKAEPVWPELSAEAARDAGTHGITVTGVNERGFNVEINTGGGLAMIDGQVYAVIAGARDIHIAIDPKVGYTVYAGLRFTTPCVLDILSNGTVVSHEPGVVATDAQNRSWRSAPVMLDGASRNAFVPGG